MKERQRKQRRRSASEKPENNAPPTEAPAPEDDPIVEQPLPSIAAAISLVLAVTTWFLLPTGFAPLITAVLALIFAMFARSSIRRTEHAITGWGQATAALWIGGIGFVVAGCLIPTMPVQVAVARAWMKSATPVSNDPTTPLYRAEQELLVAGPDQRPGNSLQARGLGDDFHELITEQTTETFNTGTDVVKFSTYSQLNEETGCCLLVYVPNLHRWEPDAVAALENMLWDAAQSSTALSLDAGTTLVVGLRDATGYQSIQVGRVAEPGTLYDPDLVSTDTTLLEPLFKNVAIKDEAKAE